MFMKMKNTNKVTQLILIFVGILSIGIIIYKRTISYLPPTSQIESVQNPFNIVEYKSSDITLINPYRGFYHHTETHSNDYQLLTFTELESYKTQDKTTLILRVFYLEDFVNSPISEEYLNNIRQDLEVVRKAGLTAILRFAYTTKNTPPYGDATKDIVLQHISQLAPIFQEYSDIVKIVQTGFIGAWGEWYYTDYFVQDPSNPSDVSSTDYQNRGNVVSALLQALPKTTFIQLRTPNYKLQFFPNEILDSSKAYSGSNVSRVGFHNDCFLASPDDYGTYQNENDRRYLSSETLFTPMGGETCNPIPPRSNCPTALEEMALFHWSFINLDYHPDVISGWKAENCFKEIQNNLGYRFVLQRAGFSNQVSQGGNMRLEIELKNAGWAGVFTKIDVEFIIRNTETKHEYIFIVADDPRNWLPSNNLYTISHSLCMPKDIEPGKYQLFLRLSSSDSKNKPLYSIQLANELLWEQKMGLNNLGHIIEIIKNSSAIECESN